MELLSKTRAMAGDMIVIKEWIENGEFDKADRIIIIGTKLQAMMTALLFKKEPKKVYYCSKPNRPYVYNKKIKWIIFDNRLKSEWPRNDYNILWMPKI